MLNLFNVYYEVRDVSYFFTCEAPFGMSRCYAKAMWGCAPGKDNSGVYDSAKLNYLCDACYNNLVPQDDYAIAELMQRAS